MIGTPPQKADKKRDPVDLSAWPLDGTPVGNLIHSWSSLEASPNLVNSILPLPTLLFMFWLGFRAHSRPTEIVALLGVLLIAILNPLTMPRWKALFRARRMPWESPSNFRFRQAWQDFESDVEAGIDPTAALDPEFVEQLCHVGKTAEWIMSVLGQTHWRFSFRDGSTACLAVKVQLLAATRGTETPELNAALVEFLKEYGGWSRENAAAKVQGNPFIVPSGRKLAAAWRAIDLLAHRSLREANGG